MLYVVNSACHSGQSLVELKIVLDRNMLLLSISAFNLISEA